MSPRSLIFLVCLLTAVALAPSSRADVTPSQKAAAEALFDQGKTLMVSGNFAEACHKFEESQRIEPGIGTMLYLAECYEKQGRTASAWALFREASSEARAAGQVERARLGASRADRLEPKLSRLTVLVRADQAVEGMKITRSGQPLPNSLWGVALPVDPGAYRIDVEAPGYETWSETVTVGQDAARATVNVPMLRQAPSTPAAAPAAGPPNEPGKPVAVAAGPSAEASLDSSQSSITQQRLIGIIVGSAGVVGMGVGGIFGLRAISKNNEAEDFCPGGGDRCVDQRGVDLTDDAKSAATVANIAVIGGAALAAAGVVIYLTAPDEEPSTALRVRASVGSVSLSGAF